jgi:hypothetical protein
MYYDIADKLMVPPDPGCMLRPVSMEGANAINITIDLVVLDTSVRANVFGSNDLQNWDLLSMGGAYGAVGTYRLAVTSIAHRYIRLNFTGDGTMLRVCLETHRL